MIVKMPVVALNEKCVNCPELEIDIHTIEDYTMETVEDGVTEVKSATYTNTLMCAHCDRCKVIFDYGSEKNAEPKSTKSKSAKVSVATKTARAKTTKAAAKAKSPAKTTAASTKTKKTVKAK